MGYATVIALTCLLASIFLLSEGSFIMDVTTMKSGGKVLVSGSVTGCGVKGEFKKVPVEKLTDDMVSKAKSFKTCTNATPINATVNGKSIRTNLRQAKATIIREANAKAKL